MSARECSACDERAGLPGDARFCSDSCRNFEDGYEACKKDAISWIQKQGSRCYGAAKELRGTEAEIRCAAQGDMCSGLWGKLDSALPPHKHKGGT